MRLAYFGFDIFHACLSRIAEEHQVIALFTSPEDNVYDFNVKVIAAAERRSIPWSLDKPKTEHIEKLADAGCEVLVAAGYSFKIPVTDGGPRGINLHPTMLPAGRGRWPHPWLLLKHRDAAGVTIHKLTADWDAGDILAQKRVTLTDVDDLETLSAKLERAAPPLLSSVLANFEASWSAAKPQGKSATYWPMPTSEDRRLDFTQPVAKILAVARAFSKCESNAVIGSTTYVVTRANGWVERHTVPPGSVVYERNRELVVACKDGFICLQEFRVFEPS